MQVLLRHVIAGTSVLNYIELFECAENEIIFNVLCHEKLNVYNQASPPSISLFYIYVLPARIFFGRTLEIVSRRSPL